MGYAMLHANGADTETPFFTPTGPLFRAFPVNRLPFAVRRVYRPSARLHTLYRLLHVPTPRYPLSPSLARWCYDIICEH